MKTPIQNQADLQEKASKILAKLVKIKQNLLIKEGHAPIVGQVEDVMEEFRGMWIQMLLLVEGGHCPITIAQRLGVNLLSDIATLEVLEQSSKIRA